MRKPWFRKYDHARRVADILERMTGDHCMVEEEPAGVFYVYRDIGGKWERA